ncbi:restriction endonuclease subunit S [Exiguobacterium artemiae]|uniref:restriction endonuclease subunit S n=1 Tax=Exiguobacterium artemiae TaxID=340145 RepID=UPI002963F911|nr:restriction endonuclease subunit S [Exiguobacterium sibiricum]MDW2884634.1 restriction endonuclease subunit S [Exiguobacterium sibiricum]
MKNNKIPSLQFTRDESEWSWKCLKDISKKVTDKNKYNEYSETFTNSAELGIINQRDYFDKDISNKKNLHSYYIVKPDDFVYNPRISTFAPVGPIKRNKLGRTGVMSPLYYVFRTKDIELAYLESYFSSVKWHSFMKENGDSGARSDRIAIKDAVFGEMPIPYPSKKIQKEIATFFNNLDESIALHQQELSALKQTKQGFLQKMFPREGSTVPEIRFAGFSEEWAVWKLNDITDLITKGTTPKNMSNKGLINFVKVENINPSSSQIKSYSKISLEEHEGNLKRSQLQKNDILFSIAGTLGRTAIVNEKDLPANTNQALAILRLKNRNVNFVATYLKGRLVKDYIRKNPTIGAQPNLSLQQLKDILILLPSNQEQIQIGKFFKNLDGFIELKERELEALKQTKKGFLQKMFV